MYSLLDLGFAFSAGAAATGTILALVAGERVGFSHTERRLLALAYGSSCVMCIVGALV